MKFIRFYILFPLASLLLVMCSSEEDNMIVTQQTNFERYLDSNAPDDYYVVDGIYVQIAERFGNSRSPIAEPGDIVRFTYAGYEFQTRRLEPTFHTNQEWILEELREGGLNTTGWPDEPEEIVLGKYKVIKGLEKALMGSNEYQIRQGDSISVFLTSNLAYGANYVSSLPMNSAVEYVIWVDEVIKQ